MRPETFAFAGFVQIRSYRPNSRLNLMRLFYATFNTDSPAGELLVAASDRGLTTLSFRPDESLTRKDVEYIRAPDRLDAYVTQLNEYFARKRREFDFPLDLRGTDFQMRCWNQLLKIPYGEVITYAELARRVGSPKGFRAVGHANGQNPMAIVVPCHRVIASDGTLGGFGGGLPMKQWLLDLEGTVIPSQRQLVAFA